MTTTPGGYPPAAGCRGHGTGAMSVAGLCVGVVALAQFNPVLASAGLFLSVRGRTEDLAKGGPGGIGLAGAWVSGVALVTSLVGTAVLLLGLGVFASVGLTDGRVQAAAEHMVATSARAQRPLLEAPGILLDGSLPGQDIGVNFDRRWVLLRASTGPVEACVQLDGTTVEPEIVPDDGCDHWYGDWVPLDDGRPAARRQA